MFSFLKNFKNKIVPQDSLLIVSVDEKGMYHIHTLNDNVVLEPMYTMTKDDLISCLNLVCTYKELVLPLCFQPELITRIAEAIGYRLKGDVMQ